MIRFGVITAVWLLAAIAIGACGVLRQLRPPAPQLILLGLTIALLTSWRVSVAFRRCVQTVDLRLFIALHVTRFVGFYFLFLCRRGELLCSFAVPAGWGDVLVATLATLLLVAWKVVSSRRLWLAAWNWLGLVDILFVVASAARHGMTDPTAMAAMLQLPLSLLITFLVPLIIATHLFIFSRLSQQRSQ